jgi:predicted unusual protein kinase regulating ubiquinone biosynthesis (AarF/ABC1/UbiB family)
VGLDKAFTEGATAGDNASEQSSERRAAELADDLERLGPTFVKLGQLLSARADLLPPAYTTALARLQDCCEPFPFADVERVVQAELGARLSRLFVEFDNVPIAAASLGQVHRAQLRGGRMVAVKVQRPGIQDQMASDLEILGELTDFFDAHSKHAKRYAIGDAFEQFRALSSPSLTTAARPPTWSPCGTFSRPERAWSSRHRSTTSPPAES